MNRRFLLVTETPPWPPDNGGRQRSNLMVRALRELGDVDLVLLARKPGVIDEHLRTLLEQEFGLRALFCPPHCWGQPWERIRKGFPRRVQQAIHLRSVPEIQYKVDAEAHEWLKDRVAGHQYSLVVGRILRPTLRAGLSSFSPTVVDIDDLDTDHLATQIRELPKGTRERRRLERLHAQLETYLTPLLARFAGCWLSNPGDRSKLDMARIGVLRNIPFARTPDEFATSLPSSVDSNIVLTVGSLDYAINRRGIQRFIERVWPLVRAQVPDAVFRIVGGGMTDSVRRSWASQPGVEPVGYAADLRAEYQRAALAVSPVYEGGGTKIKVLEALAHGRTCVVTPHSHRGYEHELIHEGSLWVGDSDERLAAGVSQLLADPARRAEYENRGWLAVSSHFSTASFFESVAALVEEVLDDQPGRVQVQIP